MLHKRWLLNSWLQQVIIIISSSALVMIVPCPGLTAAQGGLPAAYASAPAAATTPTGAGQAQPAETRTQ